MLLNVCPCICPLWLYTLQRYDLSQTGMEGVETPRFDFSHHICEIRPSLPTPFITALWKHFISRTVIGLSLMTLSWNVWAVFGKVWLNAWQHILKQIQTFVWQLISAGESSCIKISDLANNIPIRHYLIYSLDIIWNPQCDFFGPLGASRDKL